MMLEVREAMAKDIAAAVAALGEAFAQDALMHYLFGGHSKGVLAGAVEFFSILLRVRIALSMPAYVLQRGEEALGAAMGYDISRPAWPAQFIEEWDQLTAHTPGFTERLGAYEKICDAHEPGEDHYYLGVIGVHPSAQGKGAGKVLLETFCARSRRDPQSRGVYLDTTNANSLQFYLRNGFELRGDGQLGAASIWCVYRAN